MDANLPMSVRLKIDQACDRFEQQWREGQRPSVEEFLADWAGDEAEALFQRLVEIDVEHRKRAGETLDFNAYPGRFRQQASTRSVDAARHDGSSGAEVVADPRERRQLLPGEMIAERYRVVALLGQGGMGEVYRAEDLRLGQTVALKFLRPQRTDERHLRYFYQEVRLSQRLAHPQVCRVHDLVESGSLRFLSMEYIEGESLQSLLRRIGRLPEAKSLELAHQICQGLAAAHDAGVLHRDLKPANIMIDERGRARITDFGLAREQGAADPAEGVVGTLSYMAPEQLAENRTSIQSDLYSVGLILFEMFAGRRLQVAGSIGELAQYHDQNTAAAEALEATEIEPGIAQTISACLQLDPRARPHSAAALAALLPGGSPLTAVLAAGETPSPGMVAAAGPVGALSGGWRVAICLGIGLLLTAVVLLSSLVFGRLGTLKAPAALADRAAELLEELGYPQAVDRAWGYVAQRAAPPQPGASEVAAEPPGLSSGQLYFWYRESPDSMAPLTPDWKGDAFLSVDEFRPPPDQPGSVHLRLSGDGQLRYLSAIPMSTVEAGGGAEEPEWNTLLEWAGLTPAEIDALAVVPAKFVPPGFADERRSWSVSNVRIDAAALGGLPVYFRVEEAASPFESQRAWSGMTGSNRKLSVILLVWIPILIGLLAILARRNLKAKRADREGAARLAGFSAIAILLVWLLGGGHVAAPLEMDLFITALAGATLAAAFVWCAYVAFEPYVRRHWPRTLISWSRLLQGRWMDPLVGRDILIGVAAGAFAALGKLLIVESPRWLGMASAGVPNIYNLTPLVGLRAALGEACAALALSILYSLFFQLFFLMGLRMALRRTWLAVVVFVAFLSSMVAVQYDPFAVALAITAVEMSITALLYLRVGLLAAVAMHFVRLLLKWPLTSDWSQWRAETSQLALFIIVALVAWAVYASRERKRAVVEVKTAAAS
jgi:serine/threonine-protein kinase